MINHTTARMQAPSAGSSVDYNLLMGAESEALLNGFRTYENPCEQNCLIPSNCSENPASTNPLAYSCDIHLNPQTLLDQPHTFCTTSLLYMSSAASSETTYHENLGIPPFLLNPHQAYAHDPENSPLFSGGEVTCEFGIWDSEDFLINDDFGKGDFDGSFGGSSYAHDSLISNEQFELGYLSDNLDIVNIPATEQNPRLDEICEAPQVPSTNDPEIYLASDEYNLQKLIDGRFDGLSYAKGSLTSNEQFELGYLSDNLDIVNIPATEENPRLDEIYEAPQVPSTDPAIYLANDECNHSKLVQKQEKIHPTLCPFEVAATHKPRISWTSELHELFLDAVNKLDGPENATPKSILRLMDVKGLHIDHVKSHLQKYRLTMNVQKLKRDEVASRSEERSATTGKEGGEYTKRGMLVVAEAWRLQLGLQKQLHEHLMIQKDLQLRLEKQGEYLKEFLDEQQKSDSSGMMLQVHDELLKLHNSKSDSERQAKKGNSTLLLPVHKSASENSNSVALRGRKRVIREDE